MWLPLALRSALLLGLVFVLAGIGAASLIWGGNRVALARASTPADIAASSFSATPEPEPESDHVAKSDDGGANRDAGAVPALTPDGKVILNLASEAELRHLPGVGKRRAEKILELRDKLKRFRRVSDLLRVRGLGVRWLRRVAPLVVVDPPPSKSDSPDAGAARDGG